jgi:hypothetical protein
MNSVDYNKSCDTWTDNRIYGATPRHLRRIINALIDDIEFDSIDIEKTHLDDKFDLVFCNDALEHLDNDLEALKNIREMTHKYFICNTMQGKMYKSEKLVGHVRSYKKEELLEKLESAGFIPLRVIERGFPFYNLCRKVARGNVQKAIYGRYGFLRR